MSNKSIVIRSASFEFEFYPGSIFIRFGSKGVHWSRELGLVTDWRKHIAV